MSGKVATAALGALLAGGACLGTSSSGTTTGTYACDLSCPDFARCVFSDAGQACACSSGYEGCYISDGGSVCVDEVHDDQNCGGCGSVCPTDRLCVEGACVCEPDGGLTSCLDDAGLGSCASLLQDPRNCGACGIACGPLEQCTLGICTCVPSVTIAQCETDAGLECVDLEKNPDACGGPRCLGVNDAGGQLVCCENGSSVNVATDPFNCGACGNVCDSGVCLPNDAGKGGCE